MQLKRIVLASAVAVSRLVAQACAPQSTFGSRSHGLVLSDQLSKLPLPRLGSVARAAECIAEARLTSTAGLSGRRDADVGTTMRIRQELLVRNDLSVNGHSVKVITVNGRVTLLGPVSTDAEKRAIGDIAIGIAHRGSVDNLLEVKRVAGQSCFLEVQSGPMERNGLSAIA